MESVTVTPAYGRDYKSKKAVLEDWDAGKDFRVASRNSAGAYLNKEDAKNYKLEVWVRYDQLRKIVKVTK